MTPRGSVAAVELADVRAKLASSDQLYLEFMRSESLSVGLYVLRAGATDPQEAHTEDEVYVVLSGNATLRLGDRAQRLTAGSVVFVGAGEAHRFDTIESDLEVLVFFAPAARSRSTG